jgi:hypothetical protein
MPAGSAPIARILTTGFTKLLSSLGTIGGRWNKDLAGERFSYRTVSPFNRAAGERAQHGRQDG